MVNNSIQEILPLVDQPSRYLGSEINTVRKNPQDVKLDMVLAFPDLYEIGISHFGLQILYDILNKEKDIAAERVYAPDTDMEAILREKGEKIFSLESHRPIDQFDIIGFSLLYELNYTNVLLILDLAGIPFYSKDRDLSHPLIIAGGPCTCNPEPVADIFDAMIVGDGEEVIVEISRSWIEWKESGSSDRKILLKELSKIEGVYVPSMFETSYDDMGFQVTQPVDPEYNGVKRAVLQNLDGAEFPEKPILPYARPIHDRLRLEIARGCSRGCRFCQAGMIYRPVRERSVKNLLDITDESLMMTGYEDISLLSLSTGDYGCLVPLMQTLMNRYESSKTSVSLPSIRAGRLTPELMKQIKRVRKTGFTIAPEAGTQRLRDVINKGITEEEIINTVQSAFELGWKVIKLYFMVGLPTETWEDREGIVDLVKKLRSIKGPKGRRPEINISINTFIPKPHAPFQWASLITKEESDEIMFKMRDMLKMPGVNLKWGKNNVSILEGVWARGDRRLTPALVTAYEKGCKFDGWSDRFRYDLWMESFEECGIDTDFFTTRKRDLDEKLPWDHINSRVKKEFLKEEWNNAVKEVFTPDCRTGNCSDCGVCDFEKYEPKVFSPEDCEKIDTDVPSEGPVDQYKRVKVIYSKMGKARFFGHLEMVNIFARALKRVEIPVKFTEGFHPKPKLSFDDPIPLGIESMGEFFVMTLPVGFWIDDIADRLNSELPDGLKINALTEISGKSESVPYADYSVQLSEKSFQKDMLEKYQALEELKITRLTKKGKIKEIDIKKSVLIMELLNENQLNLRLTKEQGKTVKVTEVLGRVFELSDHDLKCARIVKIS